MYRPMPTVTHCRLVLPFIIIIVKNLAVFTMPFKDNIRQLADLKQQISQKILLHCSTSHRQNVTVLRSIVVRRRCKQ